MGGAVHKLAPIRNFQAVRAGGLTKAFSCCIFAGGKHQKLMPMELKLIVRRAVMRWKGKQVAARKAENITVPVQEKIMECPAGKGVEDDTVPPAAKLEDDLGRFLSDRYEFRFNRLTGATEFRHSFAGMPDHSLWTPTDGYEESSYGKTWSALFLRHQ